MIIKISLAACPLILAIIGLRCIAKKRISSKIYVLLSCIALLRLLIPDFFALPISLQTILDKLSAQQNVTDNKITSAGNLISGGQLIERLGINEAATAQSSGAALYQIIWISVMAALLIYFAIKIIRSYKFMREAVSAKELFYLENYVKDFSLHRKVTILLSDRITGPLTTGIIRPKIYLPVFMDFDDITQAKHVIYHEMVHIKRFDICMKLIALLTLCLHWFNPLVWVLYIILNHDLELSCDESVLQRINCSEHKAYAYSLLSMAERKTELFTLTSNFSKKGVQERIMRVIQYKTPSLKKKILSIGLVAFMLFVFAVSGNAREVETELVKTEGTADKLKVTVTHEMEVLEPKFIRYRYEERYKTSQNKISILGYEEFGKRAVKGDIPLIALYDEGVLGLPVKEYLLVLKGIIEDDSAEETEDIITMVDLLYNKNDLKNKGFTEQVNQRVSVGNLNILSFSVTEEVTDAAKDIDINMTEPSVEAGDTRAIYVYEIVRDMETYDIEKIVELSTAEKAAYIKAIYGEDINLPESWGNL